MDTPTSNPQLRLPTHGRTASGDERRRVAMPRRATKGPLDADIDDPLASSSPLSPSPSILSPPANTRRPTSPLRALTPQPAPFTADEPPAIDLSFLQHPSNYAPLPPTSTPAPFLSSPHAPAPNTPLETLLANGHFHAAAQAAATLLTHPDPTSHTSLSSSRILNLFYTRLAALTLAHLTPLAAQESTLLGDIHGPTYRSRTTGASILPWALRVLGTRLQALAAGDLRRAVGGWYELGREARAELLQSRAEEGNEGEEVWRARLSDLGIRVAGTLVETGDFEGAALHLRALRRRGKGGGEEAMRVAGMEAMVWLRVGDVGAARRCLADVSGDGGGADGSRASRVLDALITMAEGEYDDAVKAWSELREAEPGYAMVAQNLAVCLLYTGRMAEAREILESLVHRDNNFHALLFNLSTVYELCTERARDRKMQLAEEVAAQEPSASGWEKANVDFKL